MSRTAEPESVDLVKIGEGKTWHHVAAEAPARGDDPATATTVCGKTTAVEPIPEAVERGVDSRAEQHRGAKVCAHCRAGGSTLSSAKTKTEPTTDDAQEANDMTATKTKPKTTTRRPAATNGDARPVTRADLEKAIARAEKAIATQPARTEVDLTDAKAEKAFRLGKAIAADRWLLKKAVAGKTSAETVATMVARIEQRVADRNAIRAAK